MAEMQHGIAGERGVMVEDEWGKEWELLTQLFADDAHHCASGNRCVEGLEERFEITTLWSAFFGMEHRATKCNAVVGRWGNNNKSPLFDDYSMIIKACMHVCILSTAHRAIHTGAHPVNHIQHSCLHPDHCQTLLPLP